MKHSVIILIYNSVWNKLILHHVKEELTKNQLILLQVKEELKNNNNILIRQNKIVKMIKVNKIKLIDKNNFYHKIKKSSSILYLLLMNTKKIIILT